MLEKGATSINPIVIDEKGKRFEESKYDRHHKGN